MQEQSAQYTVLARRFRPQAFAEVVGQEHVAQALLNAIRSGRVAHAYLFTGARGVGKTSTARILAKSLNCPNAVDGNPCNECEICRQISVGHDIDVLEIDGASNRGIDDIRQLRANVSVKSMRTRYKIYIIDEVHMLTKEAFNALLKTLEEPPPNVKFVFCTTEPNKLPDTILSRCQRFDFSTIAETSIAARLAQIAEAEGRQVDPQAVELIARRAAGSMRDSQSLFDQLLAFGNETIGTDDVHRLFGTASDDRLVALIEALAARDQAAALSLLNDSLDGGVQLGELTDQLLNLLRDLMVVATGAGQVTLLGVSAAMRPSLEKLAAGWGLQTIVAAMQILADTKNRMQRVSFGRALLELALIRITLLEDLDDLAQLVQSLKDGALAQPGGNGNAAAARSSGPRPLHTPAAAGPGGSGGSGEKKNDEPPLEGLPEGPTESPAVEAPVSFEPGHEQEVLSQLLEKAELMVRDSLRRCSNAAIIAPNRLELTFPRSYSFNKAYCEKPDVLSTLQKLAEKLTGRNVCIVLRLSDEEEPQARPQPKAAPKPRTLPADGSNDEFVRQAMEIFGATVERVTPVAGTGSAME